MVIAWGSVGGERASRGARAATSHFSLQFVAIFVFLVPPSHFILSGGRFLIILFSFFIPRWRLSWPRRGARGDARSPLVKRRFTSISFDPLCHCDVFTIEYFIRYILLPPLLWRTFYYYNCELETLGLTLIIKILTSLSAVAWVLM